MRATEMVRQEFRISCYLEQCLDKLNCLEASVVTGNEVTVYE